MEDQNKTKEEPIIDLMEICQRIAELEKSQAERKRAEDALRVTRFSLDKISLKGLNRLENFLTSLSS